jgi:4-nitrophenyl phosphatase
LDYKNVQKEAGGQPMDLALFEAYFFDLDGTIYTGSTLLPGVNSIISYLKKQNKRVMYLTNTSIYTRQDIQRRLQTMGLEPSIEDIITAAYIGAMYVHVIVLFILPIIISHMIGW